MHHFFVSPDQIFEEEKRIQITGQDVNHIRQVLRMKTGEEIGIRTGEDTKEYRCMISRIEQDLVEVQILWAQEQDTELPSGICLFQCLPKSDKMEWIIQKAVELGVKQIIPVSSRRSIVKLEGSKEEKRIRRWNAVAESAAKQSCRSFVPQVLSVMTFPEAVSYAKELDILLIPYELAKDMDQTRNILKKIQSGMSIGIFIGPEGGFDPEEVRLAKEAGANEITLGRRILRTETAGIALISALMLQLEP